MRVQRTERLPIGERASFDEFQGKERPVTDEVDFVNRDDVCVLDSRGQARFPASAIT